MSIVNRRVNKQVQFIELGTMDYQKAWDYQTSLFNQTLAVKAENRNLPDSEQKVTPNYLIFCEHPHVFTLGKSGEQKNLLIKQEDLGTIGATYYQINRGGDITYHGPGQLVVYPVLDLENFFTDIHRYMRTLEESVIQTLADVGIRSGRIPGLTGVWLDPDDEQHARKICALGVKTSRWVTLHGLAFNVNANLSYFDYIIPCGIDNKAVTSLEKETRGVHDMSHIKDILKKKLASLFDMTWTTEAPLTHRV